MAAVLPGLLRLKYLTFVLLCTRSGVVIWHGVADVLQQTPAFCIKHISFYVSYHGFADSNDCGNKAFDKLQDHSFSRERTELVASIDISRVWRQGDWA